MPDREEKDRWLQFLGQQMESTESRRKTFQFQELDETYVAPVWIPDEHVEKCPICNAKFSLVFRKHHCRLCGNVICKNCSDFKIIIRALGDKPQKICVNCHSVKQK